ncbi:hypothetical protein [Rhizobium ruizarguesonis]|uniref:hypothetical protein n=1 Tax=Rhizobium ruizarguesonis TaxID=2081791 RepID=UPI0014452980|nr:hypothetical protein [Rhizobium ruizarguesonis]
MTNKIDKLLKAAIKSAVKNAEAVKIMDGAVSVRLNLGFARKWSKIGTRDAVEGTLAGGETDEILMGWLSKRNTIEVLTWVEAQASAAAEIKTIYLVNVTDGAVFAKEDGCTVERAMEIAFDSVAAIVGFGHIEFHPTEEGRRPSNGELVFRIVENSTPNIRGDEVLGHPNTVDHGCVLAFDAVPRYQDALDALEIIAHPVCAAATSEDVEPVQRAVEIVLETVPNSLDFDAEEDIGGILSKTPFKRIGSTVVLDRPEVVLVFRQPAVRGATASFRRKLVSQGREREEVRIIKDAGFFETPDGWTAFHDGAGPAVVQAFMDAGYATAIEGVFPLPSAPA